MVDAPKDWFLSMNIEVPGLRLSTGVSAAMQALFPIIAFVFLILALAPDRGAAAEPNVELQAKRASGRAPINTYFSAFRTNQIPHLFKRPGH